MKTTPKSLRLQVGLFGRTNVGKSSFLNMISGQDVAITSPVPGTTTDVVEKTMELHALGPVVFLDTAGMNDTTALAALRLEKTRRTVQRSDVILLVTEPDVWTVYEEELCRQAAAEKTPVVVVVNKIDLTVPAADFVARAAAAADDVILCSSLDGTERDRYVEQLEKALLKLSPRDFLETPKLIGDLLPPRGLAVFVTPVDIEAPKGRIKMLQVQAIRDILDHHMAVLTVKESEYTHALSRLSRPPDLVVCDAPVTRYVIERTPASVPCTSFSILMSRYKGDLPDQVRGLAAVLRLDHGDRVLIAEACSHHPVEEDIGRVKIPQGLEKVTGKTLAFTTCSGRDFPGSLDNVKLVVHCGACMITRKEMLERIRQSAMEGVAFTNYGLCLAYIQGVLDRVLSPFPDAMRIYQQQVLQGGLIS